MEKNNLMTEMKSIAAAINAYQVIVITAIIRIYFCTLPAVNVFSAIFTLDLHINYQSPSNYYTSLE